MRIWKYQLAVAGFQTVEMPANATILSVANQGGDLCMWAFVDPQQPKVARAIEIYGTGNPVPDKLPRQFVGTVLMGPFVWHVFAN